MTLVPGLDPGSLSLALGAGLVAALNPCGFALLPAYLSLFVLGDAPRSSAAAVVRALRATAALTLGFAGVFVAFGLAIAPVAATSYTVHRPRLSRPLLTNLPQDRQDAQVPCSLCCASSRGADRHAGPRETTARRESH